jgi:hypothetical protein
LRGENTVLQKILFPRRIRRGVGKGDVLWSTIDHSRALQILHNPRYAGAFAYGRTRTTCNAKFKPVQLRVQQSDWQVLIPDAHEGYISWAEYERNQAMLANNANGFSPGLRGRMPRNGSALLQGRLLCGRCGARMRVRYEPKDGQLRPYYMCNEAVVRQAGKHCQWVRGTAVDEAISALLLQTVAPAAIEVALAVQQEIAQRVEQAAALREAQLQRARYEAELARRRYLKVDPENRLVADALEADWNARLRQLDTLQREHERQREADRTLLDEPARRRIMALASDFPRVWNDARTGAVERKRMLGLLIEDVTLIVGQQVEVHVRWRGGRTQSLSVERPQPMSGVRKTRPEVHKDMRAASGGQRQRGAGKVDKQLLASAVDLTHRALQSFRERLVVLAELRIAVGLPVGKFSLVLLPQQRQCHALAAQLLMDASVVGLGVGGRPRGLA